MSVDYSAHYGIGYQVEPIDFDDVNISGDIDCMNEFLEEKLNSDKYKYFQVGEGNYSGEQNDFYVVIADPFKNGLNNLENQRDELLAHLKEIGLDVVGEFGLIGGLEVW